MLTFPAAPRTTEVRVMTLALRRFATEFNEPVAFLTDLSNILTSDPEARANYTEFVKDMQRISDKWIKAIAVIIKNPIQRAMLNLHSLMVGKTSYPVRSFANVSEALPWLSARLTSSR